MKIPRYLKAVLLLFLGTLVLAVLTTALIYVYFNPRTQRTDNLVYGTRNGHHLTIDIVQPTKPNGFGVALIVSGGWKSSKGSFRPWMCAPLLRRGYTIFAVYHLSQPQATVTEINEDVNQGIRYIRRHAKNYGIDATRLGVTGGSAGGHLSLMLATRGGPGAQTDDELASESSSVQAVAIFFPVTDLLNLGPSTENPGDGGPPKSFVKGFGPEATNLAKWRVIGRDLSPIYFVSSNTPPILIYHGDADTLVPLEQSQRFVAEAEKLGRTVKLVVHPKGGHGWLSMIWDIRKFADWFDTHLKTTGV